MSIDPIADYALFVFISVLGTFQLVFARNGVRGMLFLRRFPRGSALLGALTVVAAFTWYFGAGEPRNLPDTDGGLDGSTQTLYFFLGATGALATTGLFSSLINYRWGRSGSPPSSIGIGALERTTYVQATAHTVAAIWERVKSWIAR